MFSNFLAQAAAAEQSGNLGAACRALAQGEQAQPGNSTNLCVLARKYCELLPLTNSAAVQKELVARGLACSLRAIAADSNNATAHACAAVCYAKSCALADLRTELEDSRLFKLEAERAIALDPRQDIAYYLLGRWNYGVARVGPWSRAFVKVAYGGLPKASLAAAIAHFKQAIALAPDRIIHHAGLAMAYSAVGEKSLELAELKTCRALPPTGPEDQEAQRAAIKRLAALGQ